MEKGMEKGMGKGMEKQLEASAELRNGETTVKKPLNKLNEDFILFWKDYPVKKEKPRALKEWEKLKPDINLILPILQAQIKHKQQCDKINKFCPEFPYAERWIKNRRWEDEIPEEEMVPGYLKGVKNFIDRGVQNAEETVCLPDGQARHSV
jgi:hypothetical protein